MAKRTSSAAIGAFLVGSLALIVVAFVILGSGTLFTHQHKYVCFFTGNLKGLNLGAPVTFRGVPVGSVAEILIRLPADAGHVRDVNSTALPVIIQIDESKITSRGATGNVFQTEELDRMIKRGLRAQLNVQSLLTGLLFIDLDFHPGTPLVFQLAPGPAAYTEIPTIPTDLQQIQEAAMRALARLDKIDFEALIQSITKAAASIDNLAGSPQLRDAIVALKDTATDLGTAVVTIQNTVANANSKIDPLIASLKQTSKTADKTLTQTTATMASLQMAVQPGSPLAYQLTNTIDELGSASRAIRELADYLQRNPSALVRGKYESKDAR
jgi:paraquat-inducible protein B